MDHLEGTCNVVHRDIGIHRDIGTPLHQKQPTSETYNSNTIRDMQEGTFQVDSSMREEKKLAKKICTTAEVKITKGTR